MLQPVEFPFQFNKIYLAKGKKLKVITTIYTLLILSVTIENNWELNSSLQWKFPEGK